MSGDVAAQAGVGTAHLSSSVDDEDGPYTIHGIAIGEGDVTYGKSQTKKKWTADALKEVAETLEGQPLVKNHENDSEGTIGEVKRTSYQDGVGVIYEAEIAPHYEEFAKDVASGILDVSPRILHTPPSDLDEDDETGALVVDGKAYGDNLSLVSDGASPSNTAEIGSATAMAQSASGIIASLEQNSTEFSVAECKNALEELAKHEFETDDWVKGESSGGTWHGKIRDMKMDGCFDDEIDGDQRICASDDEPVYLIENYDHEEQEFTETMVAHLEESVNEWDGPGVEENAVHAKTIWGPHIDPDSIDEDIVDDVVSGLEDHEAVTVHVSEEDANLVVLIDDRLVESNTDLNEHVRSTLDDTPYDVSDDWNWLDWIDETLSSMPDETLTASELASMDELDDVYSEWSDHVNMTASELGEWADHECSDKASQDPSAVRERNMNLLETDKDDWGTDEIEDAKRTISFISRMSDEANRPDEPKTGGPGGCPSEWAISLLNWAYNPFDSIPEEPAAEENAHTPEHDTGTPEWEDGDMVRWQVEPDLFGRIVHVDDEKHVAMVDVMEESDGAIESTGFTITAGFSDITPIDAEDTNMEADSMEQAVEELAEINGIDINGIAMWDGKMGAITGFDQSDGDLMVEIDLLEKNDGRFEKTGETVERPIMEMSDMSQSDVLDGFDELAEMSTHEPEFSGTVDQEWTEPDMSEFTDADSWDDLSEDEQTSIADHFIVSKSGFPPETFGDLGLPVVETDGQLNLNALANAKARAGQVSGLSGDTLDSVESMIDRLANENFEDASFGSEDEEMAQHDEETLAVASLEDDDGRYVTSGQSTSGKKHAAFGTIDTTMTDINYEELSQADLDEDEYVAVREEELHDLAEQAETADELDGRLDDVNSTLDELADAQDLLDDADEDQVEELAALDEPVVRSQDEWDELQSLVSSVGDVYAEELADYSPFSTEELTDKFTPMELRDKVEEHDDAELASGDPEPEGGHVEEEELEAGEGDEPTSVDELSEEEKRDIIADELAADGLARQAEKVRNGDLSIDGFEIVSEA